MFPTDTVKTVVGRFLRRGLETRLQKLKVVAAPPIVLAALEKALSHDQANGVGNMREYGHLAARSVTLKRYRRNNGLEITTPAGHVWLIPGPRGWFLTDKQEK